MMIQAVSVSPVHFSAAKKLSEQEKEALKQDFAAATKTPANEVAVSATGQITIDNQAPGRALFPKFRQLANNEAQTGVKFENGKFSFRGYPLGWNNP